MAGISSYKAGNTTAGGVQGSRDNSKRSTSSLIKGRLVDAIPEFAARRSSADNALAGIKEVVDTLVPHLGILRVPSLLAGIGRASSSGGGEESDGSSDVELHFDLEVG